MKTLLYLSDILYFVALWGAVFVYGERNAIWVAGLSFATVFFALWIIARLQLGVSFSIRPKAKSLVTTGFYKWFSHPIYLFGALSHLGIVVAFQHWWILPLWFAIPAPFQWARMKKEDKILETEFGEEFRSLRSGTIL